MTTFKHHALRGLSIAAMVAGALAATAALMPTAASARPLLVTNDKTPTIRSEVTVHNTTSSTFKLKTTDLDHGVWSTEPPDEIAPGADASWSSRSGGLFTGTEGRALFYVAPLQGRLEVTWDNPFWGANHATCQVTGRMASRITCSVNPQERTNTQRVEVTLTERT
jgi:hypothetical protein